MPGKPRVAWIGEDDVAEILDVSTVACSLCGQAARVPEDVLAIVPSSDHSDQLAVVVCPHCTDSVTMEEMAKLTAELVYKMRKAEEME